MSENKALGKTIHYSYPKDCGKFILFPGKEKPEVKSIDTSKYKCSWTSQWSYGGHLDIRDADDSIGNQDDDEEEEEEEEEENDNCCELTLKLYNKRKWHVYYVELGCDWYYAKLLGLFDHYEGAEIFTRILSDSHNGGSGIYHHGKRISIEVEYEDEKKKIGIEIKEHNEDESFGTYLWLECMDYPFRTTHSLNQSDDWDQDCKTEMEIKIPSPTKKEEKKKKKKKSLNEKEPKKSHK